MAVDVVSDFELEKLRAEIQQEKQMKEMLDQSTAELQYTIDELEKRYDGVVDEGNEWKTRYETQLEMNDQLEKQILLLQNKVTEAKTNLKDGASRYQKNKIYKSVGDVLAKSRLASRDSSALSTSVSNSSQSENVTARPSVPQRTGLTINIDIVSPRQAGKSTKDMKSFDDLSDATPHTVRMLEKERNMLANQMRDIEWRLDQESKAYHKANEERKKYNLEIFATKKSTSETYRKRLAGGQDLEPIPGSRTPREMGRSLCCHVDKYIKGPSSPPGNINDPHYLKHTWNSFNRISNIPDDQRILDRKHGPIRKAAAVKSLPSLESS